MTLFLTFSTYGTHLPGDIRGSFHHVRDGGRRYIFPNAGLEKYRAKLMPQPPCELSTPQERIAVRSAIIEVCKFRS